MQDDEAVTVALTRREWGVVHEALDEYFYVVEHAQPGGLRRDTRERNRALRDELLQTLPRLDAAIAEQAGVSRLF